MSYSNKSIHPTIPEQEWNFNINFSNNDFLKFVLNMEEELNTTIGDFDFLNTDFDFPNEAFSFPNGDILDFLAALPPLEDAIELDNPHNLGSDTLCYGKYEFEAYKKQLEDLSREAKQTNQILADLLPFFEAIREDLSCEAKQTNQLLANLLPFFEAIRQTLAEMAETMRCKVETPTINRGKSEW